MKSQILVPQRIVAIENFLADEECDALIARAEALGFEPALTSTKHGAQRLENIRNNDRVIFDDSELAAQMWTRLAPFVPSPLFGRDAIGLNERWRYYRYWAGQTFKRHQDGSVKRTSGEKTQMTLLLYLNDDCVGGETRFYLEGRDEPLDLTPKKGAALLFLHTFWHEGTPVVSGRKYVLRSDVFYSWLES